jgi:hypothetical protein
MTRCSRYPGRLDLTTKTIAQACCHVPQRVAGGVEIKVATSADAWKTAVNASGHGTLMALVSASAALRGASDAGPAMSDSRQTLHSGSVLPLRVEMAYRHARLR